jgi:hypothetical protein
MIEEEPCWWSLAIGGELHDDAVSDFACDPSDEAIDDPGVEDLDWLDIPIEFGVTDLEVTDGRRRRMEMERCSKKHTHTDWWCEEQYEAQHPVVDLRHCSETSWLCGEAAKGRAWAVDSDDERSTQTTPVLGTDLISASDGTCTFSRCRSTP